MILSPAVLGDGGDLSRDAARRLAHEELQRPQYAQSRPPLLSRLLSSLLHGLRDGLHRATVHAPGGATGVVVLLVVLAGLVAVLVLVVRPSRRESSGRDLFDAEQGPQTAAQHRALADRAADGRDFAEAVRERLRAVVRELEARGVLDARAGRTADEVAAEAGALVPALRDPLRQGARLFGEIWYGGRDADAESYAAMVEVDRQVTSTRMAVTG